MHQARGQGIILVRCARPGTATAKGASAVSNYRVRQVLALGPMPDRQLRFLIALATWLPDDSRAVRVGLDSLIKASGNSHNTVRKARRELEAVGKLASVSSRGRGHLTLWIADCLPEKGTSEGGPLCPDSADGKDTSDAGPFNSAEKVPTRAEKRYQAKLADLQEPKRGLKRMAKALSPSPTCSARQSPQQPRERSSMRSPA